MRVIACCWILFICLSAHSQPVTFRQNDLVFEWDPASDEAHVIRMPSRSQIWQGSLLPAFWVETDHKKVFLKAELVGPMQEETGIWRLPLKIGALGHGTLTVVKEDWGLRFSSLDIEWSASSPAIIEMYFGATDKTKDAPVQPTWDRPFMPDWQSFGYCVPGGREGPAQSYFRNWDFGLTNIALGSFGPSMGTPYGAAYPKPLYFSGMGSNEGFIALGAGSIPDAAMSLRVQSTRGCFQYVYDEDIWGALPGRKRSWTEPLRISLGPTAYEAFKQYYRSFPARPSTLDYVPLPFYNTWGLWRERKYTIGPIGEFAGQLGAATVVLDDGWEQSQGAGVVNSTRFPHLKDDLKALHDKGMTHGIWETLGWIADTAAAGLTSADLIMDRKGRPCKANWNFDPSSPSYYCLDISSGKARNYLQQRTIRQMQELQPSLIKLDFGYGLPAPSMGVPRDPAYRGERQHAAMLQLIATAARSVNPSVRMMYYGISPLSIGQVDLVSLDDQGDLWYDIAGGHGEWSIWASLLSDKRVAVSGSSGYSWEPDDEVLLNTAIIGCPGATLPITQPDGKPVPEKYLLRRLALNKWYRRTLNWHPQWFNSHTGNFDGPPRLSCWGRMEDTALTALALREDHRSAIPDGSRLGQLSWKGRWALISQDNKDILSTQTLAIIPFDAGEIVIPCPSKPTGLSRWNMAGSSAYEGWQWADGRLTIQVTEDLLQHTAGFLLRRTAVPGANAQQTVERNLLSRFSREQVAAALVPQDRWHPFPQTAAAWRAVVPDSICKKIIASGEKYLSIPFSPLPATLYLEFKRTGNRTNFEDASFGKRAQLFALVLAESMEQKGRFTDAIVNGVWSFCEETFWGVPAHYYLQQAGLGLPDAEEPSVDIFASETAEILALTDYLVGAELDSISPLLRRRIYYEVNRRVLVPLEKDSIPYSYLGPSRTDAPVNNWDPWVVSNWMISLLLLEKKEDRRVAELHHGMRLLDNYINGLGDDGAVDEGPSYWSGGAARLFDALRMLEDATAGKVTVYNDPTLQKLGAYIMHMHIAGNYFIDIADASPTIAADGLLICRVGQALKDNDLRDFGAWAWQHIDDHDFYNKDFSKPRVLWNLLALKDCQTGNAALPAKKDIWFSHLQLMAGASGRGLFLAAHGGHNGESHNHNDVGDFMVYADGQPVVVDVGFGTYNAKTFSKDRYQLWYLNSAHHNVPLINDLEQLPGERYGAHDVRYTATNDRIALEMDIAKAYPDEAGVKQWVRTVQLDKKSNEISVADNYRLDKRQGALTQTLMTVCPADLATPGRIVFSIPGHHAVLLEYDARDWDVKKEEMSTTQPDEKRVADNWGHRPIWRLLLVNKTKDKKGIFLYKIKQL